MLYHNTLTTYLCYLTFENINWTYDMWHSTHAWENFKKCDLLTYLVTDRTKSRDAVASKKLKILGKYGITLSFLLHIRISKFQTKLFLCMIYAAVSLSLVKCPGHIQETQTFTSNTHFLQKSVASCPCATADLLSQEF